MKKMIQYLFVLRLQGMSYNSHTALWRRKAHVLSSHRFANAAYLSQYIPGLDPESERAKTFRTKMAKRSAMLMLQAGAALLVLILSSVFLIWAVRFRPPVRGVGDFLYGRCSTISFINFAIHVLINVISSLFLGAGNYCMQILIAPSREEINKAHRKGEYVEIGVPSVRNFWYIRWYRIAAWVFISLLATTLHVL